MRHLGRTMLLGVAALAIGSAEHRGVVATQAQAPDRLVLLVFDQMRPDYIDRYGLRNFQALRAASSNYREAYVGHLGSQTVVSHLVIPTGRAPRDLPWQDDVVVDRTGALGRAGAAYETGRLHRDQFWTLLRHLPREQYLPARVRARTGRKVVAIGEKDYATYLLGTPEADAIVTMAKASGACRPTGVNVPDYIAANPRFVVDCTESYGTALSTLYALDGSHYVPGRDPAHLGGDVWTTDAALEVMAREEWGALLLTFGGIDKVGHMLGEPDGDGLTSVRSGYRLADVARVADEQLGRLLDALRQRQLLERTLLVVTADHGGQTNRFYLGNNKFQSCCPLENSEARVQPPYWIEHLTQIGKLHTAYQDTSVKLWLADQSADNERAVVAGLADISGMVDVYALRSSGTDWRYERAFSRRSALPAAARRWADRRHDELMQTMAAEGAPHLVGLLADGFGFGRIGDHGGAQERVQRIPMFIRIPGERGRARTEPFRLMDIDREVTRVMRLAPAR